MPGGWGRGGAWLEDGELVVNVQDPDAGKDCGQAEKEMMEDEMLDNVTDSMDMSLSKRWEIVKDREAWHAAIHEVIKSQTQSN